MVRNGKVLTLRLAQGTWFVGAGLGTISPVIDDNVCSKPALTKF